jgi:putative DNA primase/helicase
MIAEPSAGRLLDAALLEIERAIREKNYAAAQFEARTLAPLVASGGLHADRIRGRFLATLERANVHEWRAGPLAAWLMAAVHDPKANPRLPPETRDLPQIRLEIASMDRALDDAAAAVLEKGTLLFERAGSIVRLGDKRDEICAHIIDVSAEHLQELFNSSARFERLNAKTLEWVEARCPGDFAKTYLARRGLGWNLPSLRGVINAPTLRDDASVLDMPGYDQRTGLYLDLAGTSFPQIPNSPTLRDAALAADCLLDLLREFPFVADEDRSVAFAAILTAVARRALPAAPMFAFTAPAAGTGKSYLVDIVALIATGRPAAGLGWSQDAAENRKTIESALVAGAAQIVFDNVSCEIAGDRLNQVLTQPEITLRILGQTRNVTVPCGAMVMANGNALTIAADMTRRTMLCRLDAGIERPELRRFTGDPVGDVRRDRGQYLAAALTILRAYHVAGRPDEPQPLASFDAWSAWVRGALLWLEMVDPVASMDHVRASDPRRSDHLAVMQAWNAAIGDAQVGTRDIISHAARDGDLREALLAVAGAAGNVNTAKLGFWLRSHRGKLAGGMKLDKSGETGGAARWFLTGGAGTASADIEALM